jgi:hypothetical protein
LVQGCVVKNIEYPELKLTVIDSETLKPLKNVKMYFPNNENIHKEEEYITDDKGCIILEKKIKHIFLIVPFHGFYFKKHSYFLSKKGYNNHMVNFEIMSNVENSEQLVALCKLNKKKCISSSYFNLSNQSSKLESIYNLKENNKVLNLKK